MNVPVTILGQVGNNCLRGSVATQPGILVVEDVLAVSHQVVSPVLLEEVDAVFPGLEQAVEFEISVVVVADRVVEDHPRLPQDPELGEVPPVTPVGNRIGQFASVDGETLPGSQCGKVKGCLIECDRRKGVVIQIGAGSVLVFLEGPGGQRPGA